MFDSLDEQMKKDEAKASSPQERVMKYALYVAAALAVFGGLYYGMHFLG